MEARRKSPGGTQAQSETYIETAMRFGRPLASRGTELMAAARRADVKLVFPPG